jgi:uncharacterized protein (DUF2267 family)
MVVRQMDYAELLQQVQTAAAVDWATAKHVSLATVATLAERMSHDELVRLGARLPNELQAAVRVARRPASRLALMSSSAGSPSG